MCDHKNVTAVVNVVQERCYELLGNSYHIINKYDADVDWSTATIKCDRCNKVLSPGDLNS